MSDHYLTEYGTTQCPVEHIRAWVDDGECSAGGANVLDPAAVPTQSAAYGYSRTRPCGCDRADLAAHTGDNHE